MMNKDVYNKSYRYIIYRMVLFPMTFSDF